MSNSTGPRSSSWHNLPSGSVNLPSTAPGWQVGPARTPYRPRWRRLGLVALAALAVLAAVTWVALWIRPPEPARLVVFEAGYDATLAVPPNPYGKAAARTLAAQTRAVGWGARGRLRGAAEPERLTRPGPQALFPQLDAGREKCVVVVLAAHGGRDRDGAFLFPDDATPDPAHRVRIKAVIDRLAQLPPERQKLLVLDATQPPAFADLGLIHNDFAAGLGDLHDDIAAVPNLVVFTSTGPDEQSWACPEWGTTAFGHFLTTGLAGAADANGDRRVSGWELIEYARPRTHDWARDHRAALQTPVVLPRGDEGERRARAMHLAMADPTPPPAAPPPFEPPPEVRQAWEQHRDLARATPPPQAYTPHLWRQYEAWLLRHEQHALAGDADGAKTARDKADALRRRIEDDRRLAVRPQTLALPAGVGIVPAVATLPDAFATGIGRVAAPDLSPAERAKEWDAVRAAPTGTDPATARLLWGRALLEHVAADPPGRLAVVPAVLALTGGFDLPPAELNFLAVLAKQNPKPAKAAAIGPLLQRVLTLRAAAERAAACVPDRGYPYAEFSQPWVRDEIRAGDVARRQAEDLCFASGEADWAKAAAFAAAAEQHYGRAAGRAAHVRTLVAAYHTGAARVPALGEWLVRDAGMRPGPDRRARELAFRADVAVWERIHAAGTTARTPGATTDTAAFDALGTDLQKEVQSLDSRLARQADGLIATRPEFEGAATPRADAVRWWHAADALLTAPPPADADPARRVDLLREARRVTRQLIVTAETRPEALPEVAADVTRDRAFDAARRRGQFLLARVGPADFAALAARVPGEGYAAVEFRTGESGFPSTGRQSLAEAGSRLGEVLAALPGTIGGATPPEADRLIRLATAPAAADVTGSPAAQLRRIGVRELLLTQARRTLEDHWYGPQGDPYYRRAVDQLAADARKLVPPAGAAPDAFAALQTPEEPFPVQATAPTRVTVTDEPDPAVTISFTRHDGPSGRPGFPVFRAETKYGADAPPPAPPLWAPVVLDANTPPAAIVRPVARPPGPPAATPAARTGAVRVDGFFRGRPFAFAPALSVYDVPHQAAVTTPRADPYAKLAVRADPAVAAKYGLGAGSVAFVLDCSGSMRANPDVPNDRGLYPLAVDALADVLGSLPPGTVVSVRTFGQRTPGAQTADDTIRELVPPTRLPLDRGPVVAGIVASARAVPANDLYERSPVVRAVLDAKAALRAAPGPFKAVVLISDAIDTRFADDPAFAKRSIGDVLRTEFTDAGVPLAVVALPVTDPGELAAQAVFRSVEKLRPAGKFVPPAKAKELGVWLRTGLNPRVRYAVEPVESDSPVTPFDLTATPDVPDEWYAGKLPRGRYRLRLAGSLDFRRDVNLGDGDRLLLDLAEDGDRLALRRHWYAATAPAAARAGDDAWKLALLQNRLDAGTVRMLAAVEGRPPDAEAGVAAVDRVGEAWFEVTPAVPRPTPVAVRWRAVQGFPAPTWAVDVKGWPGVPGAKGGAAPQVGAWWSAESRLHFPRSGDPWAPPAGTGLLAARGVSLPGGDATLDAVTVETHAVEVLPGVVEKRPCLVARLTHTPGKPAWVRPVGDPPAGSEVRLYRDANRTTCLYWWNGPLTATTVADRVTGFEVVSLAAAKSGPHLELTTVPPPSEDAPVVAPPAGSR